MPLGVFDINKAIEMSRMQYVITITKSRLLVYEIDDEELTSQWGVWEDAGLPEPTVVMDSGNKSYHVWHA